jgi:hypothetical protein
MSTLREIESESIRAFVQSAADRGCFAGRVLDYGSGKQPYRGVVESVAEYVPYDRMSLPGSCATTDVGNDHPLTMLRGVQWNAILCTQVVQYVPGYVRQGRHAGVQVDGVTELLEDMHYALVPGGCLVLTGPTNWPVVEPEDLHRFTVKGIVARLQSAGFTDIVCDYRAGVTFEGAEWPLGWGAMARKAAA